MRLQRSDSWGEAENTEQQFLGKAFSRRQGGLGVITPSLGRVHPVPQSDVTTHTPPPAGSCQVSFTLHPSPQPLVRHPPGSLSSLPLPRRVFDEVEQWQPHGLVPLHPSHLLQRGCARGLPDFTPCLIRAQAHSQGGTHLATCIISDLFFFKIFPVHFPSLSIC